jgi:hypothetical protein
MSETDNNNPTTREMARAADGAYALSMKADRNTRLEEAQARVKDYTVIPQWTDKHMTTYKHDTKDHHIIAHRGTDLGGTSTTVKKDLVADWNLLTGNHANDDTFKKRTKRTEAILKGLGSDGKVYLTGHSLGGGTVNHAMVHSKKIRDRIEKAETFNSGATPVSPKQQTAEVEKVLKRKMAHHRIIGDDVSMAHKTSLSGKHLSYKSMKSTPSIGQRILGHVKPLLQKSSIGRLASMSGEYLLNSLKNHSISNFT